VRLRFIGERSRFSPEILTRMRDAEGRTRNNRRLHLTIAASYGGRQDIAHAARAIAEEVAAGRLRPEQVDETVFGRYMALADVPPPDLFIRTGGDRRISNFMLWQMAYTELWFTETLWPELDAHLLQAALDDFAGRERRFGLTSAQVSGNAAPSADTSTHPTTDTAIDRGSIEHDTDRTPA
jgi:undecaprenyl diphosphate synthase